MGTITEFSPDTIMISTAEGQKPVSYGYSKTTTYVDEAGKPVSLDLVKSGVPVTVYYTGEGSSMVANKVVVRKTTTTGPGSIRESKTTTTTTP